MIIMQLSFRVAWTGSGEETKWNKQIMSFLRFASFFPSFFCGAKFSPRGWKIGPESWLERILEPFQREGIFAGDGFVFLGEVDSKGEVWQIEVCCDASDPNLGWLLENNVRRMEFEMLDVQMLEAYITDFKLYLTKLFLTIYSKNLKWSHVRTSILISQEQLEG